VDAGHEAGLTQATHRGDAQGFQESGDFVGRAAFLVFEFGMPVQIAAKGGQLVDVECRVLIEVHGPFQNRSDPGGSWSHMALR
jgi:hypothetical protein